MTIEEAVEYLNTLYMALAVFPNQQVSLGNVDEMKESVEMAIKALLQEPKWIPVKEKLPEIQDGNLRSDIVWSCQKYGDGYMWQSTDQCTSDGTWISEVPFDDPRERCKVVAWMPLPEPYQEGATKWKKRAEVSGL